MAFFQLDPSSIAARCRAATTPVRIPTLAQSLRRGILGFTALSVAGFSPWPILERWFHQAGETGLYLACTAVFVALSGLFLHRLILVPGSLRRFYQLFSVAFIAYAAAWVALWVWLRGDAGEFWALVGGAVAMGGILALAFGARRVAAGGIIAGLFALNAVGYYAGRWCEGEFGFHHRYLAMGLWALCYGVGFGAGLGLAFHLAQREARGILARS